MKIAIVHWEDPVTKTGWMGKGKARKVKVAKVISVGILLKRNKRYVRLAMDEMDKGEQHNTIGVIPRRSITHIEVIDTEDS